MQLFYKPVGTHHNLPHHNGGYMVTCKYQSSWQRAISLQEVTIAVAALFQSPRDANWVVHNQG